MNSKVFLVCRLPIRPEARQFRRFGSQESGITLAPAPFDADVYPFLPASICKRSGKHQDQGFLVGIAFASAHQHTDLTDSPLRLLRARRERSRHRNAAKQRN